VDEVRHRRSGELHLIKGMGMLPDLRTREKRRRGELPSAAPKGGKTGADGAVAANGERVRQVAGGLQVAGAGRRLQKKRVVGSNVVGLRARRRAPATGIGEEAPYEWASA
jgi:hypothetical protein